MFGMSPTKLLFLAAAIFILYKLLTNDKKKRTKEDPKARERKIASGKLVKDPVCGTYVDAEGSISVKDGDKLYHFCSYECRQQFLDSLEASGRTVPQINGGKEEEDD